jgi:UDP-glucose 4-epimerase
MKNPSKYQDNITGTVNLLDIMVEYGVKKIIFSSTAAVYGEPEYSPIDEKHRLEPINYYGFTKQKCEEIIDWYSRLKGIIGISLRYFNVAGDAGLNYVDPEAENIFPIIMEVYTGKRDKLVVFGNDYDTRDGTCIRDYIDVNDLVDAHILALDLKESAVINLGSEQGTSVKELIDGFEAENGRLNWEYGQRRKGDPAKLTASAKKAFVLMKWKAKRDIKDMIKSTVKAYGR